jgi:hypothetical protein
VANLPTNLFPSLTPSTTVEPSGLTISFPYASLQSKGAGYYGSYMGTHTFQVSFANGFAGIIKLQASLATIPGDSDWFDLITIGDGTTTMPDQTTLYTFTGNFVWVRGLIPQFATGVINGILYSHN